jgi:probable rRNA maturation factor
LTYTIRVFNAHPRYRLRHVSTVALVRRVLRGEKVDRAALNIIFIQDRMMIALNSTYLRHRYTTDVLSFSLNEHAKALDGEVYVNLDQARRQAKEYSVSEREERKRLVVHGILHLTGYEDATVKQREEMHQQENIYLF